MYIGKFIIECDFHAVILALQQPNIYFSRLVFSSIFCDTLNSIQHLHLRKSRRLIKIQTFTSIIGQNGPQLDIFLTAFPITPLLLSRFLLPMESIHIYIYIYIIYIWKIPQSPGLSKCDKHYPKWIFGSLRIYLTRQSLHVCPLWSIRSRKVDGALGKGFGQLNLPSQHWCHLYF